MIFQQKLLFQGLPYQPATGEVVVNISGAASTKNGVFYAPGLYRVEVAGGATSADYNYANAQNRQYISIDVHMDRPFYIEGYSGSGANKNTIGTNPYSGPGKAQSTRSGNAQSDGIFGGAGADGHLPDNDHAPGGGNAVGNGVTGWGASGRDGASAAGSACHFQPANAGFTTEYYKCFHVGGMGALANTSSGGGGGAYGGGAGGNYNWWGGSGTGGSGGGPNQNGNGIGKGRTGRPGRGGLAYFDGTNWIDCLDSMEEAEGKGYLWSGGGKAGGWIKVTYLGSELSNDYTFVNVFVDFNKNDTRRVRYVKLYTDEQTYTTVDLSTIEEDSPWQYDIPVMRVGSTLKADIYCWLGEGEKPDNEPWKIHTQTYQITTPSLQIVDVDAILDVHTFNLKPGVVQGKNVVGAFTIKDYETQTNQQNGVWDAPLSFTETDFGNTSYTFTSKITSIDGLPGWVNIRPKNITTVIEAATYTSEVSYYYVIENDGEFVIKVNDWRWVITGVDSEYIDYEITLPSLSTDNQEDWLASFTAEPDRTGIVKYETTTTSGNLLFAAGTYTFTLNINSRTEILSGVTVTNEDLGETVDYDQLVNDQTIVFISVTIINQGTVVGDVTEVNNGDVTPVVTVEKHGRVITTSDITITDNADIQFKE